MSIDLSSRWLGLRLKNPLVASAGPLSGNVDTLRRLEDAGVSAVVLPSIFEEQIEHEDQQGRRLHELGADTFGEAMGGRHPELPNLRRKSEEQLELVRAAKGALDVPVIASLNGATPGGWTGYARLIEETGADGLELNLYGVPADPDQSGEEVERGNLDVVREVRSTTRLPLAVKISPFYSSPGHMAARLVSAGADGLVLFNRFVQPDIDLETLAVEPRVALSTQDELRLPLRWIGLLRGRIEADLGATSGVHQAQDVLKLVLAGADVTMTTSALLKRGAQHAGTILDQIESWMEEREFASLDQIRGSLSQANAADPVQFERSQYQAALTRHVWRAGW